MNQKGLTSILIVLLLFGVVALTGGAYYFGKITVRKNDFSDQNPMVSPSKQPEVTSKQSPDPVTDWKTYTSGKYGFSFKYPSTWNNENRSDPFTEISFVPPLTPECSPPHACGGGFSGVSVSVFDNKYSLTIKEFVAKHSLEDSNPNFLGTHFVEDAEPGIKNWVIDRLTPGGGPGQAALITYEKDVIRVYCGGCSDQITNQIISSFKFTDQENGKEKVCGGFAGETGQFACPEGYSCKYPEPIYADAQGVCVKK